MKTNSGWTNRQYL